MKVILTEKVPALGNVGEVVNVSPGYARNFLIPKRCCVVANDSNKKDLDHHERILAKKIAIELDAAKQVQAKLNGITLEYIKKVGANGKLFGAITTSEISNTLLNEREISVERRLITLDNPIKSIGTYEAKVKILREVNATFTIKVDMSAEQAKELKEKEEKAAKAKKAKAAAEDSEVATDDASEATAENAEAATEQVASKE